MALRIILLTQRAACMKPRHRVLRMRRIFERRLAIILRRETNIRHHAMPEFISLPEPIKPILMPLRRRLAKPKNRLRFVMRHTVTDK